MRYTITIDGAYVYTPVAGSAAVAVRRAMDMHDKKAKERRAAGFQSPRTITEMARKTAVRIYLTAEREPKSG